MVVYLQSLYRTSYNICLFTLNFTRSPISRLLFLFMFGMILYNKYNVFVSKIRPNVDRRGLVRLFGSSTPFTAPIPTHNIHQCLYSQPRAPLVFSFICFPCFSSTSVWNVIKIMLHVCMNMNIKSE